MNFIGGQGRKLADGGKLFFEAAPEKLEGLRTEALFDAAYRKVGGIWTSVGLEAYLLFEGFAQAFLQKEERFLFAANAHPDNSGSAGVREAAEAGEGDRESRCRSCCVDQGLGDGLETMPTQVAEEMEGEVDVPGGRPAERAGRKDGL